MTGNVYQEMNIPKCISGNVKQRNEVVPGIKIYVFRHPPANGNVMSNSRS